MLELAALCLLMAIIWMAKPYAFAPAVVGWPDAAPEPERKDWEDLLMFKKGGGSKAPAPDPQIGAAALREAQLGEDWLKFAKEQFNIGNERQKEIDALTNQVTAEQLTAMKDANTRSTDQWERYKSLYQPVEDRVVSDAMTYDSAERQEKMAAEAKADVAANASSAQQQNQRQMASMGIDPRSGRFAGVDRSGDLTTALASAGAQNNARDRVRATGMALREGVANMGRGATSTAAQQAGLGLSAGNSASGNALGAEGNWRGNVGIMGQGYGGAMQGYAGQANILNNLYGNQLEAWKTKQAASSANSSGLMSGIGSIAGAAMSMFSS